MRKKYAVAYMLSALMLLGVSNAKAASKNVDVNLFMGDTVRVFDAEPTSGILELPGLYQTEATDPGKGEALKDACRFKGSTLVINAKVKITATGFSENLSVVISFTKDSGIQISPSEFSFTISAGQAENTVPFVISVKDVSTYGVYPIKATAKITDASGKLTELSDTENVTINMAELTVPPKVNPGVNNPISYNLTKGYIENSPDYFPCDILAKLKIYESKTEGKVLIKTMILSDLSAGIHPVTWDGLTEAGAIPNSDLFYFELEITKQVYIDNHVVAGQPSIETTEAVAVAGAPSGGIYVVVRIPDDLSGVDINTVTPALVPMTIKQGVNTYIVPNYKVVQSGTSVFVTALDLNGDYYKLACPGSGTSNYTVTLTATPGGALDKAGNVWDVDGNKTNGIQNSVEWNFDLDTACTVSNMVPTYSVKP